MSAVTQVMAGNPIASPEIQAERKSLCFACPLLDKVEDKCLKCGCSAMGIKRSWATTVCPESKWGAVQTDSSTVAPT